ncbi:excalibur calcium-binding domain-containing protein [Streptomyces sp. CB03238]|uniref:excalibur calcium-binding domain-containing protein n=1 Tax=Streptomyces sp. CB03238 TaxID=1907777 RepID=UPI000A113493|nr:excalibur calcium-binding domain-containing protein [Streptomyces sp. CB03238]ORT61581.1 hypothetical protein BKD26_00620 [Streptomyces sp. CB03238]
MSNAYQQPPTARPLYRMKRVWAGGLLLLLIGTGCGAATAEDTPKPAAAKPTPTVTVTVTTTATATATVTATPTAAPAPTVTVTKTVTATATVTPDTYSGGNDDAGGDVYYSNCADARAAGATPVRRGDPGYGRHLDRDNDGVGCDNG